MNSLKVIVKENFKRHLLFLAKICKRYSGKLVIKIKCSISFFVRVVDYVT